MVRAGLGAGLGLLLADAVLWALTGQGAFLPRSLLIAPFGATAFLIFAVPNSPLAQPWSAIVGNTLSALAALALGLPVVPAISAAVLLAVLAMAAARAQHPPGGAVAIATVLAAPGPGFAVLPVLAGTVALVVCGVLWNRGTGRLYPFRLPKTDPAQRQTPGTLALAAALADLRMGANVGVEDLSRLIAAAETAGAAQSLGPLTAADVMTRDLITLGPGDGTGRAVSLFRSHGFRHLPLAGDAGRFSGLVPQIALLGSDPAARLIDLAPRDLRHLAPAAPLAGVLALMAQSGQTVLPVTAGSTLAGLITRSDLLAALIHVPNDRKDRP
jgi:CBS domain-containing membrane protein